MSNETIRALVDLRDKQIQKARIQFSNRLSAIDRGDDPSNADQREVVERWLNNFDVLEQELNKDIARAVKRFDIYDYVTAVHGIGPGLAAKLVSMINIERSDTVSQLWRYAGYAVIDGEAEKKKKGEKMKYNARLKTVVFQIGSSFLKTGSPYADVYYQNKEYYEANRDWTPLHCHLASMRKMGKLFLSHLWVVWRTIEGLDTREPYAHDKMGHSTLYMPQDFGWPDF